MQRILFVCTGNTCRSPMAEAILKNKQVEGIEVKSAGIYAANGNDASHYAKMVLAENRIPHSHQSSPLTESNIQWATLILTMTASHKATINAHFPNASDKTFTLKEFTENNLTSDVMDPYGGDISIYRFTYEELNELINIAIKRFEK